MILGIFDSGLGGLTVLREIIRKNTYDRIIYYGDTLRLPYGEKDRETLLTYAREDIGFLISKGADEIVIACGTVSSNVLDEVRNEYSLPIMGIIDVLCAQAEKKTVNGRIGVIATPATVRTGIFAEKLKDYDVYEMACQKFTPLIEAGMIDSVEMDDAIEEYLGPLKDKDIDTLILGCTHYPLLEDKIRDFFGRQISMINSGTILADELSKGEKKRPELEFYVSGDPDDFRKKARRFIDVREIEDVRKT
ncbi:MAG: glutamate racemase [Erysipelotrichaceae bacterium]|nr:glutamate racemase [Erysipelotrichaceae bacterium]